ncbi:hypothetical protein NDU88_000821 [Pleurodeles waltl]|uniref:Uncharacterized protein n=1 Tax=Pleurodeles waltl TaxID=8319 RepID=A0AAV7SYG2_PLEWA|nr:hypothetical protein NDU88_000821 [Pleurodeles waltl]
MRPDGMLEQQDSHSTRLDTAEQRISYVVDGGTILGMPVERVEWLLKAVAAKNEDLEARSRLNNIHITCMAKTTNTGRMDTYIERLLLNMCSRDSFTATFAVEKVHQPLGPRPISVLPLHPSTAHLLSFRDWDAPFCQARDRTKLLHYLGYDTLYSPHIPHSTLQ